MLTGSCSSGSNCSANQKDAGGTESEPTKQEVSAAVMSPGDDGNQQHLTFISGLLGDKDSKELPPALSPSRAQPSDLSTSQQSFCLAMGNPSDFFVDVM